MNLNNISAWSIRNPVVPIVLFVALTIAGVMSFMNMDVQNDPDIEFPVVVVSISQPGAAPTETDKTIGNTFTLAAEPVWLNHDFLGWTDGICRRGGQKSEKYYSANKCRILPP